MPRTYTFEGKRQQRWTKAHTERAIELRKQGLSYEAIGKELGFTAATAMRYVKGPQPKPEPKSEPPLPRVATPRRIMNSASRGTYVPDMAAPTRPGAMDYAAVRSRGI